MSRSFCLVTVPTKPTFVPHDCCAVQRQTSVSEDAHGLSELLDGRVLHLQPIVLRKTFFVLMIAILFTDKTLHLRMFLGDQGSWMVMFFSCILFLFIFSWIYNLVLLIGGDSTEDYAISHMMGIKNSWFLKAAACGTWSGDFFTAWMVILGDYSGPM